MTQIVVTEEQLVEIVGSGGSGWANDVNAAMAKFSISDENRAAAFIAQCAHESGGFKHLKENLSYSSAERIYAIFRSRYTGPTDPRIAGHVKNPEGLANHVYADRYGNRDAGDGWKYRGRGLIQITFRENYFKCSRGIGVDILTDPSLVEGKAMAAMTAAWFFSTKGCNSLADRSDIDAITRVINPAMKGAHERSILYAKALDVLRGKKRPVEEREPEKKPTTTTSEDVNPTPAPENRTVGEPESNGNSKYPHNKVYESPSGHIIEVDDAPGNERLVAQHRSGANLSFLPDGDTHLKAVRDSYYTSVRHTVSYVGGNFTQSVKGTSFTKAVTHVTKTSGYQYLDSASGVAVNAPVLSFSSLLVGQRADLQALTVATPIAGTAMFATMLTSAPGGYNPSSQASSAGFDEGTYTSEFNSLSAKNGIKLGETRITVINVGGTPALMYNNGGGWQSFAPITEEAVAGVVVQEGTPPASIDPVTGQVTLGAAVVDPFTLTGKIIRPKLLPDDVRDWLEGEFKVLVNYDTSITAGDAHINGDRAVVRNGWIAESGDIAFDIVGLDWKVSVVGKIDIGSFTWLEGESEVKEILDEGDTKEPRLGEIAEGSTNNPYQPLAKVLR